MAKKTKDVCSFCGREMRNMFRGEDGSLICPECIEAGHQLIMQMGITAPQAADAPI